MNYYYCIWQNGNDARHAVMQAKDSFIACERFSEYMQTSDKSLVGIIQPADVSARIINVVFAQQIAPSNAAESDDDETIWGADAIGDA